MLFIFVYFIPQPVFIFFIISTLSYLLMLNFVFFFIVVNVLSFITFSRFISRLFWLNKLLIIICYVVIIITRLWLCLVFYIYRIGCIEIFDLLWFASLLKLLLDYIDCIGFHSFFLFLYILYHTFSYSIHFLCIWYLLTFCIL